MVKRLNAGLQAGGELILISASAGFGKTTLATEWIKQCGLESSVAWVSLDKGDNDPIRFLSYLIAALQQVDPGIGESALGILQSSQSLQLNELVVQLINQVAASGKNILLFFDDYHLITSEAIHQMLELLIERQPSQMRTVILTREDPPLPLPRMRVRGQVTEVRERDLRFSLPEAQAFLVEAMGLDLSPDEVDKLKERTEGWVAGMQLAALALEDSADEAGRRAFIEAFAGSDRYIVDYLISEVLERQPEAARQFLLDTSILERFCADLCDQVVYGQAGAGCSQPILAALEQGNMFLVPLDNQRQWYRYHHLFGEMLNHSLRRSAPQRAAVLHRRASEWLEAHGFIPEAVKHATSCAIESGDWDFAKSMLDRKAMQALFQLQSSLVIGWCREFPIDYLEKAPEIAIYHAWSLVLTFREDYLKEVEEKLHLAERALQKNDLPEQAQVGEGGTLVPLREWVTGHICVIRSQILLGRLQTFVDPQELIDLSLKGLELLPEGEKASLAICKINLAHAQTMQNHPVEAQKAFDEALPFMLDAHNYLTSATAIYYQARLAFYMGQLDRAEVLIHQWKAKFAAMFEHPERDAPATRGLDVVLSILLLENNQVDAAERLLTQALELLGWASWMELLGFIVQARLYHLRGDLEREDETLHRMAIMGPQHASTAEALSVLFALKTAPDDPQARSRAETWAGMHAPDWKSPFFALGIGPYHCDVEYFCNLTWAKVQVALGYSQSALAFIVPALKCANENDLKYRIIELTITQALAQEALGNHLAAAAHLTTALDLAEPCGYLLVFDEGPELDQLLREAAANTIHPEYVQRLLSAFHRKPAGEHMMDQTVESEAGMIPSKHNGKVNSKWTEPGARIELAGLIEPISEREMEVLRLIAAGLSNAEIGQQLYIAQGTVKRHITNLYGKLTVQTRTQAIAKAREIGLLA